MFDQIFKTHGHLSDRDLLYTILENQFLILKQLSIMQADVQALTNNVATLGTLIPQLISAFQNSGQTIDPTDLTAVQATNTALTPLISSLQAVLAPTPPATPAA